MWDAQTIETGVLEEFAGLCRIPHPSGQEKAIAQHLTSQLEALGFSPMLDHAGNLLCDIPGRICDSRKHENLASICK